MLLIEQNDEKYNEYMINQCREELIKFMMTDMFLPEKFARALFCPHPITDEKKEV